jgi:16S rRNA (cytosine1402-N4)-methyltransferase
MHIPVLLKPILNIVPELCSLSVLDCTFGRGGYSRAFLERGCFVTALDRDIEVKNHAELLKQEFSEQFNFILGRFSQIGHLFQDKKFDVILFDIGVSSPQLDQPERGFSFNKEGPLDMRMGESKKTAADIINYESEETLANIFYHYGEETASRKFARLICSQRQSKLFETTKELADIIEKNSPKIFKKAKKIHPATKIFQALRIAVNDELNEFEFALKECHHLLNPDGMLILVTFHSLEDRIAKNYLKENGFEHKQSKYEKNPQPQTNLYKILTKKPMTASDEELKMNPRASCAKLRIARRTYFTG